MSTEEEPMQAEATEPAKEVSTPVNDTNENFVVLDVAVESEDSDKDDKAGKETKEKSVKSTESENGKKVAADPSVKPETSTRPRKKPKAPVVDVNSLRRRKWQLKVYPLHAEDLQLNYMSILCKLASESLLYIPSEGRHGKAELYVATQKETATIIGKLLRMGFHHETLSIEVVRKDTGGKEDDIESKKECKAFLMFDKFLTKKIYDAKGEKGTAVEKTVTLSKLPKAATKDFISALFPFATEITIIDSEDPNERKAAVTCKTPVTALLVYKSFKRLEINDVHIKLSIDESVKEITLPPLFFVPPTDKKDTLPPDSMESLNQSSLRRRPGMTSLNIRVQQIKKRALLNRRQPTRGQFLRAQRPNHGDQTEGMREPGHYALPRRVTDGRRFGAGKMQGTGPRDYPFSPGRRRMMERQNDWRNRNDAGSRSTTNEMLELQTQLSQAIKNQIAMLNKTQVGGSHMAQDDYSVAGSSHKPLMDHTPRLYGGASASGRVMEHRQSDFGGNSWSSDRGGRVNRAMRNDSRSDRFNRGGGVDRSGRPEGKRVDLSSRMEGHSGRYDGKGRDGTHKSHRQSGTYGGSSNDASHSKGDRSSLNRSHGSERSSSHANRGRDYSGAERPSRQNDRSYGSGSRGQSSSATRHGNYPQADGDGSYYNY